MLFVAGGVPAEFLNPELSIVRGRSAVFASFVLMPETAVYKNGYATADKNDVWFAWKFLTVKTKPITPSMKQ